MTTEAQQKKYIFQSCVLKRMIYQSSPAWTMKSKSKDRKKEQTPSPDSYQPKLKSTLSKSPSWKLGKQLRNKDSIKDGPSPTQYNILNAEKINKFGIFSKQKRMKQKIEKQPGPGSYEIKTTKQEGANSFAHSPKCTVTIYDIPGPGAYESKIQKVGKGIKMNRQQRFINFQRKSEMPGPGKYESSRANSSSMSFGKAERIKIKVDKENITGPGHYSFKTFFDKNIMEGKGYTQGMRHTEKPSQQRPGPASYSPTCNNFTKSPSVSMLKRYTTKQVQRSPSPDQYNPQYRNVFVTQNSFSIGKADKLSIKIDNDIPGPGAYLKTEHASTGMSISLGISRKVEERQDFPGPGAYNPNIKTIIQRPVSAKIGRKKRFEKILTQTVESPVFYQQQYTTLESPKFSFSREKKLSSRRQLSPGPGSYNIPSSFSNLPIYAK